MHEQALMQQVIEAILEDITQRGIHSPGNVKEVSMRIGALDMHSEESFRQAYAIQVRGTILDHSELKLMVIPATLKCEACGYNGPCPEGVADGHDPVPVAECPSCGKVCHVVGGRGVDTIELSVEKEDGS